MNLIKNIGVLISDHNVRDTMNICNRVLIVNKGEIIADGHPEEISNDPLVKEVYLGENLTDKSETKSKTKTKLSLKTHS